MKFYTVKVHGHNYKFILITDFFDSAFKYGDGAKFWGYVGTNVELLWIKFCNFVQWRALVNYLTVY
jgi:hypothetical protein